MRKHLEYKDEKSNKFWEIAVIENTFTVTYGKIGTDGQSKTKTFESAEKASAEVEKLIKQKLKKGYVENSKVPSMNATEKQEIKPTQDSKATNEIDYYQELIKFDEEYGGETYAQSFWILDDEDDFFEDWLFDTPEDKVQEYSKSMKIFASADGTGARYAFWLKDKNTNYNNAPIICYGSEGAIVIVAENIKDLIKMLSLGAEGMDGNFYHYIDNDDEDDDYNFYEEFLEYTPNHLAFRKWIKETLGIEPVNLDKLISGEEGESEEINKMQEIANKKLEKKFNKWQYQFYPNPEDEETNYYAEQQVKYEKEKKQLLKKITLQEAKAKILKKEENTLLADLYLQLAKNETILEETDFDKYDEYLEKALGANPNHIEALKKLAKTNNFSNPKKAIYYLLKLIEIHDKPQEFYSDIAFVYMQKKTESDSHKAIDWYTKDITENQKDYGEYSQDYIVDICKKYKIGDAIDILEETLKKRSNQGTHKVLYKQYFKKKKYQKAQEHALQYIELSNEQSHNFITVAEKFFKKELYNEAAIIFTKTLKDKKDPWLNKLQVTNYIGLCYLRQDNETDTALKFFNKAYKADKDEIAVHQNIYTCGTQYFQQKKFNKALKSFNFCIDNFDYQKAETHNYIGVIYDKQDKNKEALIHFENAVAIDTDNELYFKNLTYIKNKMGKDKGFLGKIFGK